MTTQQMNSLVQEQLARDLGCDAALLDTPENVVVPWQEVPGRRQYKNIPPKLEAAIWNGKIAAACAPELLGWAEDYFARQEAQWLFCPARFREMDAALSSVGYQLCDAHHFYLPDLTFPPLSTGPEHQIRWYEGDELEQFRGDERWKAALSFDPLYPDVLAAVALDKDGTPCAMAGASRDCSNLWQIGIAVLEKHRKQGLAVKLTALLKEELLSRNIVPFYGTSESHIVSQNVARSAGFRPAFAYLYAQPLDLPKGV